MDYYLAGLAKQDGHVVTGSVKLAGLGTSPAWLLEASSIFHRNLPQKEKSQHFRFPCSSPQYHWGSQEFGTLGCLILCDTLGDSSLR